MRARVLLLLVLGACGKPEEKVDTERVVADTAITRPDLPAAVKPPCPATGNWAECSIFERLDRAGLAPRRDSSGATEPALEPNGLLFRIGNSELEVYLYPDLAARRRSEATLDKTKYADPSAPLTMPPLPTLITSVNLIAILHSRNEHQRERVADAITAGPPQPVRP